MFKQLSSRLRNYKNWSFIRFLLRLCPGGRNVDFYMSEQSGKAPKNKSNVVTTPLYTEIASKLRSIPIVNNELRMPLPPNINLPHLHNDGRLEIEHEIESLSSQFSRDLKKNGQPNDPSAFLLNPPRWKDGESLTLSYNSAFYSDVKALREYGHKIHVLSAAGVLFSEDKQCLLVHRRSSKSDYYPDTLHTFGGGFIPPGIGERGDINGLKECLVREIQEESGISLSIPDNTPKLLMDEYNIGFIQTAFLGMNISSTQVKSTRNTCEGKVVEIPFNELYGRMKNIEGWTISGWTQILLWLALGTPNSNRRLMFGKQTAEKLCQSLVDYITNECN